MFKTLPLCFLKVKERGLAEMKQPVIKFEDYGFQYHSQANPTLYNIDLTIYQGEKILIVGPSGSGKSTLANCINGLIPFSYPGESTGSLTLFDNEVKESSLFDVSKKVGTVLQDPDGQFIGLTVAEDIAFSLENEMVPQEEMRKRVLETAKTVRIDSHLDYSPQDLSGGQKQRVSLGGVLVDNVPILLFDEPLANLDPATGTQTIELIDRLRTERDTTMIIIEHRLEDVLYKEVDRIIVIVDGRIVADLPPNQLISTTVLEEAGIREPLYVTALKYAGIQVTPEIEPAYITTLKLDEQAKDKVSKWYTTTHPESLTRPDKKVLEVNNLSFAYVEGVPVLEDVSFNVNKGEIVAIAGSNGAGKSTLSKVICGFEPTNQGSVLLGGENIQDWSITQIADNIGFVMQNPNQMISKTMIFDEVALGLLNRGLSEDEIKERVEETLKVCGLYPFRNWPISALSFGQKKRVTIAAVLVLRPEIIILDEPTAGQDFRHYTDIMEFLETLNAQGVTIIMITHDMHLMLEYAPRALVFSDGRLIADTTSADVLTNERLSQLASLKPTSLYKLATDCGIADAESFVQHFIDYDREVRRNG